jgi:hypothetical protein
MNNKSSKSQGNPAPMTPTPSSTSTSTSLPLAPCRHINFDDESTPSKRTKYEDFRLAAKTVHSKTDSKDEVILRQMVIKSEKDDDVLFAFFVFNALSLRDDIDKIGSPVGKYYYSIIHYNINV